MLRVFKENACLTDEEISALDDWIKGETVVHTAMRLSTSPRRVDTIRQRLRQKYDIVQSEFPDLLPPRKIKSLPRKG